MKVKVRVVFDIEYDASGEGKSTSQVSFSLPDHPKITIPEDAKFLVVKELAVLSAALAASPQLFK